MSSVAKLFLALKHGGTEIPGESHTEGYERQIEVEDWNWNLTRPKNSGDAGNADKAEPSVLTFSKFMDRSTTALLAAAKEGHELQAKFTLESQTTGDFKLVMTLEKVRVTRFDMNMHLEKASATIEETWDFNYQSIAFAYTPRTTKGASAGTISTMIERSPGASTASPEDSSAKLITLAGQLSSKDLELLIPKMQEAAKEFDKISAQALQSKSNGPSQQDVR